jgi:hypothetical protein
MRSIALLVFAALIAFAVAQKIKVDSKGANGNTVYRCDFNIPNLGAKNESVICEPNRMIEPSFNITITISTTSPVGTPDWTLAIYHGSTAPTEVMNPIHQKGVVKLVVNIRTTYVTAITFRNLNSYYAIGGYGFVTFSSYP